MKRALLAAAVLIALAGTTYWLAVGSRPPRGGLATGSDPARGRTGVGPGSDPGRPGIGPGSDQGRTGVGSGSDPATTPAAAGRSSARNVLLITVDTLRADRVGAYGWQAARTPALDGLARRGTRFTRAFATAPITLPSHATLLTGRYPPGHGARHNGVAASADTPSIVVALDRAGFETGAFVSAFPLDSRFGLATGFDVYDDELPRDANGSPLNERPGPQTVDRALAWLRARPAGARVFMWVHLFEPHAPYAPQSQPGRSASDRYDDEVAAADHEIGRLVEAWRDRSHTLIIATADHGEAFGEHGERGHSIFVYDTTLRVPLILAGAGVPENATVDAPVTLADLAPTLADAAGLDRFDADGVALGPLMRGTPAGTRALYAESFAPLLDFGWAPLRTLRRGGLKLIAAPRPELYDLEADPAEQHNAIRTRAAAARELSATIDRISSDTLPAPQTSGDREALARLRALGYLGAGGSTSGSRRADPKDRIAIASRMAAVTSGEARGADAERALREVLRQDAGNPQAHQRLGFLLAGANRCAEAEPHFTAAIRAGLPSADPHIGLAGCQAARGALMMALATLDDARRVEPENPVVEANVGMLRLEAGQPDRAVDALRRALDIDPGLHQARFTLARALARSGQRQAAFEEATRLLQQLPAAAPQRPEVERLVAALR